MKTTTAESGKNKTRTFKRTKIPFSHFKESFGKAHHLEFDEDFNLIHRGRKIQPDELMGLVIEDMKIMGFLNSNRIDLEA